MTSTVEKEENGGKRYRPHWIYRPNSKEPVNEAQLEMLESVRNVLEDIRGLLKQQSSQKVISIASMLEGDGQDDLEVESSDAWDAWLNSEQGLMWRKQFAESQEA